MHPLQALAAAELQFRALLADRRHRSLPGAPLRQHRHGPLVCVVESHQQRRSARGGRLWPARGGQRCGGDGARVSRWAWVTGARGRRRGRRGHRGRGCPGDAGRWGRPRRRGRRGRCRRGGRRGRGGTGRHRRGGAGGRGGLALRRANQVRRLHRLPAGGEHEHQRRDDHARHGDDTPGGRPGRERAAVPPGLGAPPLAQPVGQRRPLRGPAVDRRGGDAEGGEEQQAGQQRAGQLVAWSARRRCPPGRAAPGSISAQFARSASHHLRLLTGLRRAQERRLAGRTGPAPRPAPPPARWTAR